MNNKGNIQKAYLQFQKDLQSDPDYIQFKENANRKCFSDELEPVTTMKDKRFSLQRKEIVINYNVPQIHTKENRALNSKVR